MKMNSEIRVRTSKEYTQVYDSVRKGLNIEAHVLFFVCFCFAVSKRLEPIEIQNREDKFWSRTITPQEWTAIYTFFLDKNNMNLKAIEDDEVVIRQAERYANAGMKLFLDELPKDFIRTIDEKQSIVSSDKGETIKALLFALISAYFEQENRNEDFTS